jgi:hypothetical protein
MHTDRMVHSFCWGCQPCGDNMAVCLILVWCRRTTRQHVMQLSAVSAELRAGFGLHCCVMVLAIDVS